MFDAVGPKPSIVCNVRSCIAPGVVAIIFAVISVLSFVDMAGQGGKLFSSVAKSLFGWGFFVIPIAFAMLAFSFIKSISRKIYASAIVGTSLFSLSILGIFYLVENKVKEGFKLFRLPFLLSLILIGYLFLGYSIVKGLVFVFVIWVLFVFIYIYRNNNNVNRFFNKLLGCCKRR